MIRIKVLRQTSLLSRVIGYSYKRFNELRHISNVEAYEIYD